MGQVGLERQCDKQGQNPHSLSLRQNNILRRQRNAKRQLQGSTVSEGKKRREPDTGRHLPLAGRLRGRGGYGSGVDIFPLIQTSQTDQDCPTRQKKYCKNLLSPPAAYRLPVQHLPLERRIAGDVISADVKRDRRDRLRMALQAKRSQKMNGRVEVITANTRHFVAVRRSYRITSASSVPWRKVKSAKKMGSVCPGVLGGGACREEGGGAGTRRASYNGKALGVLVETRHRKPGGKG